MKLALTLFGSLIAAVPALGQEASALLRKGEPVVIVAPMQVMKQDGIKKRWEGVARPVLVIEARYKEGTVTLSDRHDWISAGFPSMMPMLFEKQSRKSDYTEVEFRPTKDASSRFGALKLRVFSLDPAAAVKAIAVRGGALDPPAVQHLDKAYEAIGALTFTDFLSDLSPEQKKLLVSFAHMTASGTSIRAEKYKGNGYMVVDLGRDTTVYNDLRFSQNTLVARVINEQLLKLLKAFAAPVEDAKAIYGLKLEMEVPHRSFAQEYAVADTYKVQIYTPSDLIRKFADADITSQQLIDGSVVMVDDNRIEVSLAAPSGD